MERTMADLSVRNLDERALRELKRLARARNTSVNALIVELLEQRTGVRRADSQAMRHDDLDALAGRWSKVDAAAFAAAIAPFGEPDPELWQ
jgi:predicted DNA-binding ribbon-helix-helix protein